MKEKVWLRGLAKSCERMRGFGLGGRDAFHILVLHKTLDCYFLLIFHVLPPSEKCTYGFNNCIEECFFSCSGICFINVIIRNKKK